MINHGQADALYNDFVDCQAAFQDLCSLVAEKSVNMHSDGNPSLFLVTRYFERLNNDLLSLLSELTEQPAACACVGSGNSTPTLHAAAD